MSELIAQVRLSCGLIFNNSDVDGSEFGNGGFREFLCQGSQTVKRPFKTFIVCVGGQNGE